MKTRLLLLSSAVILCAVLMLPAPVQATAPEPLTITADMWLTGETTAAGSFTVSGLFSDGGAAYEEFFIAGNTIHGVKTLTSSAGTITIKFQAQLTWTSPTTGTAEGQFVIVSGTGAYEKLHGVGKTYAALDLASYHISATYSGKAHFD